ncbi:transcriptional regulator [Klebsiella michiganensis]|uniref:Transcriptional regulator n=1 Tax=Klebsiella michiganensis TaxID=1134687 RepID=A0A7H4N082_9ENTR|nr:transcriptional regulator [Klebsiella michiganensis]
MPGAMVLIAYCGWGELDDGDYIARKLGNIKMTTCASPSYIASHGVPQTLEDLQQHQASTGLTAAADKLCRGRFRRQKEQLK